MVTGAKFKSMTVGDRIRYIMEVREVKQTELAERLGIRQSAISNLVTDSSRKPSAPTLFAMAAELHVNPAWILTGEGDPYAWAPVTHESQVELLNLFKGMTDDSKKALLAAARAMGKK